MSTDHICFNRRFARICVPVILLSFLGCSGGTPTKGPVGAKGTARTSKTQTVDEKVERFKLTGFSQPQQELIKFLNYHDISYNPDKRERPSYSEVNREFSPKYAFHETTNFYVDRFFPFETASGPAYRVNLLWVASLDGDRDMMWASYLRSPN